METLGKFIVSLIIIAISIIVSGFIFMKTWAWFIVPAFGLSLLTIQESIGISVFISIAFKKVKTDKDKDFDDLLGEFFVGLLYSGILFFFAWIIYLFIN